MKFLRKIEANASQQSVDFFMRVLRQTFGSKVYMNDIESSLDEAVAAGVDLKDLDYLSREISNYAITSTRNAKEPWRR